MLLANYSYINQICGHNHSGITNPVWVIRPHTMRGYYGGCDVTTQELCDSKKKDNFPTGGNIHAAIMLSDKGGLISATTTLYQSNGFSNLNLAGGLNGVSTWDGTSTLTGELGALAYLITSINGSNTLSGDIQGAVNIAATLAGIGDLTGALGALISILADLNGNGDLTGSIGSALNAVAALSGSGDIAGSIVGVVEIITSITGSSTLTSSIIGNWDMIVALSGSSTFTSDITALAHILCTLVSNGTITLTSGAVSGDMSSTISSSSELSPENLAASVWNSLASSFNTVGTMGEIMNNVGAGADPWSTIIPGAYTPGQAGHVLGNLLSNIPDSVWDELKMTHTTSDSYGKIVQDLEKLAKQIKSLTISQM